MRLEKLASAPSQKNQNFFTDKGPQQLKIIEYIQLYIPSFLIHWSNKIHEKHIFKYLKFCDFN